MSTKRKTLFLYSHNIVLPDVWVFLHQAIQFSADTNWVSYNSVMTLPVVIRFYKLRAQSHKTAPILDTNCKSQIVIYTSDQLVKNQGSYNPLHRFDNLLEQLTELRKHFYWFTI